MNTVPASKKRKVMTLDERVRVIKLSNQGDSARKIAASLGVGKTQVQTVIRNKEEILKEWESGVSGKRKYNQVRKTQYDDLNRLVWEWFCSARAKGLPVSGTLLQSKAIMFVIPNWPTQPYYSKVMEMLVSLPLVLPCQPQLLQLPHDPHCRHPLFPKLQLLACKLSGNPLRAKTFQDTLPTLSSHLGAQERRSSIKPISTSGLTTVVKGKLIHFIPL